jgi:hypothetical protein
MGSSQLKKISAAMLAAPAAIKARIALQNRPGFFW